MRAYGAPGHAEAIENCAAQIEAHIRERALEALSLEEAVAESGYSYSSIQKKLASGELPNVGNKGSPRVRRSDLPKKVKATSPDEDDVFLRLTR